MTVKGPFFNPQKPIDKGVRPLPHWQQGEVAIFVTWRVFGSLPIQKFKFLKWQKNCWQRTHPQPWTLAEKKEFHSLFSQKMEVWLDQCQGECPLRNGQLAEIVADNLLHFNGTRFDLASFVIMPNHVHVLFRPHKNRSLAKTMKSWKGFSTKKINKKLQKKGPFWQEGYWDRLIRKNPLKAGLGKGDYIYYQAKGL